MIRANQKDHWDHETLQSNYCSRHIAAMERSNIAAALRACLKRLGISPGQISHAVEIGGGSQVLSRALLHDLPPTATVTCTDVSPVRIDEFTKHYGSSPPNLQLLGDIDAQSLPFDTHSLDLVFGDAVLHHIEVLKFALFEINRCLRPGGHAIFVREPVVGELGVYAYRALQILKKDSLHIERNRYEYKRTRSQWLYEFIVSGFAPRTVSIWHGQSIRERLMVPLSYYLPTYPAFALRKVTDVSDLTL